MVMTLRQAAQQALAQLEINRTNFRNGPSKSICKMLAGGNDEVIAKLRAALAEQPAEPQDPVAYNGWVLREVLFDNGEPVGHREPQKAPDDTALLKQALTAIEQGAWDTLRGRNVAADLRERLELMEGGREQPAEPVAWAMPRNDGVYIDVITPEEHARCEGEYTVPLYAAPQPRREVELTDEEIQACGRDLFWPLDEDAPRFARAVIEAYKAKQGDQT